MKSAGTNLVCAYDASDRAIIRAFGKDVLDLLQRVSTNDLASLCAGEARPTILLNEKGRILEVITVIRTSTSEFLLVSESTNGGGLLTLLQQYVFLEDAHFEFLARPHLHLILLPLYRNDTHLVHDIDRHNSLFDTVLSRLNIISTFDDFSVGPAVVHVLLAAVRGEIEPVLARSGIFFLDAELFSSLRIRLGIPAMGRELSTEFNPLEAGLTHLVSTRKGCFTGQEVLARIVTYKKLSRRFVNLLVDQSLNQLPMTIFRGEHEAGILTSCALDGGGPPFHALGYVRSAYSGDNGGFTSQTAHIVIRRHAAPSVTVTNRTSQHGNLE